MKYTETERLARRQASRVLDDSTSTDNEKRQAQRVMDETTEAAARRRFTREDEPLKPERQPASGLQRLTAPDEIRRTTEKPEERAARERFLAAVAAGTAYHGH